MMKRLISSLVLIALCFLQSFGNFDYTISDTYKFTVDLNNQSLLVTGAGVEEIHARGESYVEIHDTTPLQQHIGGIYALDLDDFSTLYYLGGEMGGFHIYDYAEAVFSGGRILAISSYQDSDIKKHITFICDVDSVSLTDNLLTGDWLDDKGSFSITLQNQISPVTIPSILTLISSPNRLP